MTSYIWMWEEWCVCVMVSARRDEDWGISAFIKFVTIIFWYILTHLGSLELMRRVMGRLVGGSEDPNMALNDSLIQISQWSEFGTLWNFRYPSVDMTIPKVSHICSSQRKEKNRKPPTGENIVPRKRTIRVNPNRGNKEESPRRNLRELQILKAVRAGAKRN